MLVINLSSSISAKSQSDTLSKKQIDSLISWISYINTDLIDYDLVKQKSSLQSQQIKGLQAIERKQSQISIRKEMKLSSFSSIIIDLQGRNTVLESELKSETKKKVFAKIENWVWRGSALFCLYLIIR